MTARTNPLRSPPSSLRILRARPLVLALLLCAASLPLAPRRARAEDDATSSARSHYEMGLRLFDVRDHEQALIEFQKADELKTRPASLFMMAQCEYLLGRLKNARAHYERYVNESPGGEFVELAKDRIESIDKRLSTFVINTVPDDVTVHIALEAAKPGARPALIGQAPNNFQVPRGRYRIDVTKPNFQGQTRIVEIDLAETKPLFFKLDPIPARLEIETAPPGATLYVNGNRALNPYRQNVVPGRYEIIAEAQDFTPRAIAFELAPGERKLMLGPNRLALPYVQRSGRPELIVASGLIGAFIGAGAVGAAIGQDLQDPDVASVLLATGGGVAGAVVGVLAATPLVPRYVPDNRAFFILGTMWMGAAEGAGVGVIWSQSHGRHDPDNDDSTFVALCPGRNAGLCRASIGDRLQAAFVGSLPGLALGLTTGALMADRAPTYGRVALIQSAALGGTMTGALLQMALQWKPYGRNAEYSVSTPAPADRDKYEICVDRLDGHGQPVLLCSTRTNSVLDLMPGALVGLNVGLAAGLLAAYLPDQSKYGPTWKRVLLIDLAAGAGALAGGVAGCVANADDCLRVAQPSDEARAMSATAALAGGAVGLVGGILLTRHFDDDAVPARVASPLTATATIAPLRAPDGSTTPGLVAVGSF